MVALRVDMCHCRVRQHNSMPEPFTNIVNRPLEAVCKGAERPAVFAQMV